MIEREKAEIGVLITMESPTKPMLKEAAEAGFYAPSGLADKYPRIQILSIEELLEGKKIDYPRYAMDATFKKAPSPAKPLKNRCPLWKISKSLFRSDKRLSANSCQAPKRP